MDLAFSLECVRARVRVCVRSSVVSSATFQPCCSASLFNAGGSCPSTGDASVLVPTVTARRDDGENTDEATVKQIQPGDFHLDH